MSDIPTDELFACGCSMHATVFQGVNTVTILPCSVTCPLYLDVIAQAERAGMPVQQWHLS